MKENTKRAIDLFVEVYNFKRYRQITEYKCQGPALVFVFENGEKKRVQMNQVTNTGTWDRVMESL